MIELGQNDFCCIRLEKVVKQGSAPLLWNKDPRDIDFAGRRINYCPFCGIHFTEKGRSRLYTTKFCCDGMDCDAEVCDPTDEFDIFYQPWARRYLFSMCKEWRYFELECEEWDFYYCLHCGTKLPESLEKVWREVIEKECGVVPQMKSFEGIENTLRQLPEKFRTEQWWRERGL